ncbi:MAG: redoxin domain-containing protein [Isosphaeraceae bacterium]
MSARRRLILAPLLAVTGLAGCTVESEPTPTREPILFKEPLKPKSVSESATVRAKNAGAPALLSSKTTAQVDVGRLMTQARGALESNNFPNAIRYLEEVLLADPQNRDALSLMARATQSQAMAMQRPQSTPLFLKSGDAMRRLRDLKVELTVEERNFLPAVLYNEACTLALTGDNSRALKVLTDAYDSGFGRVELLDADPELDSLRKLPEFQALQHREEKRAIEATLAGTKPFRFDFQLPDLDGKTRTFAELKGDITIVDIWGTWCLPCRKEIPHLIEIARRYKDRGVRVVGLNYEQEEGEPAIKAARAFIQEFGITYPCLLGDTSTQKQIPTFQGYPTMLFLDRDGKVRLQITGYQSLPTLETAIEVMENINKALAGKSGGAPASKAETGSEPTTNAPK